MGGAEKQLRDFSELEKKLSRNFLTETKYKIS